MMPSIHVYQGHHCWQGRFTNDPRHTEMFEHDTIPLAYPSTDSRWQVFEGLKTVYPYHTIIF